MRKCNVLILHISDLHLREGVIGSTQDPDAHLRESLVNDAVGFCDRLGKRPDIVAISGDIAFGGQPAEYAYARSWLQDLCRRCGIDLSKIFVIPGNHDVVRDTTKQGLIKLLHKTVRDAELIALDSVLSGFLKAEDSGPLLYKSIEPFNDFAVPFLCSLYPPDRTIAERRVAFQAGWTVRFLGVNSTFLSNESDRERSLCVDVAAKQIVLEPGTINVVLCHHPYVWLKNGDDFSDHLAAVSQLHLFGHVHTSRIDLHRDFVRVSASAAHPDRQEHGWEPGYNLVELDLTGTPESPSLRVRVHVRVWQQRPGQFRAKEDRKHSAVFEQTIALDRWSPSVSESLPEAVAASATETPSAPPEEVVMETLRSLSLRFFALTASQRALVAGKLDLVEEADKDLPEFERTRRILLRAKKNEQLPTLATEIDTLQR